MKRENVVLVNSERDPGDSNLQSQEVMSTVSECSFKKAHASPDENCSFTRGFLPRRTPNREPRTLFPNFRPPNL